MLNWFVSVKDSEARLKKMKNGVVTSSSNKIILKENLNPEVYICFVIVN